MERGTTSIMGARNGLMGVLTGAWYEMIIAGACCDWSRSLSRTPQRGTRMVGGDAGIIRGTPRPGMAYLTLSRCGRLQASCRKRTWSVG